MGVIVKNATKSLTVILTYFKCFGFWIPEELTGIKKLLYYSYTLLSFMFILGTFLIIQTAELFVIWGDLSLVSDTLFLLLTNMVQAVKITTILTRRKRIEALIDGANKRFTGILNEQERDIVKSSNKGIMCFHIAHCLLAVVTVTGWSASAEKGQFPLRAWYPYDTSITPAYELTFFHQVLANHLAAQLNVSLDLLIVALVGQCRCRMTLINHALKTLGNGFEQVDKLTVSQEATISSRLRSCAVQHQEVLYAVEELQTCFSEPIFAQFTVSLIIICVSAFHLSIVGTDNVIRLVAMTTYLINMAFQVFIYCYQGNQLTEESRGVADAAYSSPWHKYPVRLRRSLLIVMVRSRRVAKITAQGFTTLSLDTFTSIIKVSYSMFTLLKQVNEK